MSELLLRKMLARDIDSVLSIQNEADLSAWSEAGYINELKRTDSILYVAEVEKEIAGFVVARLINFESDNYKVENKGEGEILNIAVIEQMRGKGIGTKLLQIVIQEAIERSVGEIWLEVRESNISAQSFYRANGFTAGGKRRKFYNSPSEDAVLMCLKIT